MDGLLGPAVAARLGSPRPRRSTVAQLEVGAFGVLDAVVDQVHPSRVFQRKRGGEGMLCRVTLSDATGTIDLVLWDDEIRLTHEGPLVPGGHVRLRGATVKAGYRGGIELGLGSAVVEPMDMPGPPNMLAGVLRELGATQVVDGPDGPSFKAEAVVDTPDGPAMLVAWDDAVKALQGAVGDEVVVPEAVPHPALPGCWIAGRARA